MEPLIYLFIAAILVGGYFAYRQVKARKNGKKPTHGPVPVVRDIPVRKATEKINVPGVTPVEVEKVPPVEKPALPATKVSLGNSFIKITPDQDWRDSPTAGQHEAGDMVPIEVEVRDAGGRPLGGIAIRGIIDLQTGKSLGAVPETGVTGPDGYAHFSYIMQDADVGKNKLVTAILLDDADNSIALKPTALV